VNGHVWLVGPRQARAENADIEVDCHRLLRGPYTGTGTMLRALVPEAFRTEPALVRRHAIEILSIAPELRAVLGPAPETLTSLAIAEERTRFYPAARTRRLANGIADFLQSYVRCGGSRGLTLSFARVDEADHTDQEFLAIMLRRIPADQVTVIIGTRRAEPPAELAAEIARYTHRVDAGPAEVSAVRADGDHRDPEQLLRAYIESDGTSEDPAELAAYQGATGRRRAALHDARAAELRGREERSLRLGAIPYHLAHGSDPADAGGDALWEAAYYCTDMGFYHAAIDCGLRGRAVTDPETQETQYSYLTVKIATALAVLGRPEEAEQFYLELLRRYTDPGLHMRVSYALAMLYTRSYPAERRDHNVARVAINTAIAIATQWPDPAERAFHVVFNENGRALIEMHQGQPLAALRFVSDGLDRLDRELAPGEHQLHRSVLAHNRGNVLAALGRLHDALADFDAVIEADPNYPDYYFDRAGVRRRLGDYPGALADLGEGIARTPPFWELHYNRGDLRAELGDLTGAITDFSRVVDLEPSELDARVNLVGLLLESGELAAARAHIDEGLSIHPDDPQLVCARGRLAMDTGDIDQARQDFDLALSADARLVTALASRASISYQAGQHDAAVSDLTLAIEAAPHPDLLYNRGLVHEEAGRWQAAIDDFTRALELPGADRDELARQRALCQAGLEGALASKP
jgi:tetratricopeptide (TPR) repeat protein